MNVSVSTNTLNTGSHTNIHPDKCDEISVIINIKNLLDTISLSLSLSMYVYVVYVSPFTCVCVVRERDRERRRYI